MGKPSSSENEETERKAGFGCELAPKIQEGKEKLNSFFLLRPTSYVANNPGNPT